MEKRVEEFKQDGIDNIEKRKARITSIKEGSAASVMSGTGDAYVTPFALAIGANNVHIGFLSSIPNLLSPLAQIKGSRLMEKSSRKKIVSSFVLIQALMWLFFILVGFLFWKDFFLGKIPWLFVALYGIYAVLGGLAGPAWFSWMGDIVPEKIRGKYFSKRNRICGTIALITTLLAGFFLDYFKTHGWVLLGFSILFIIATITRLISARYFTKQYEPEIKLKKRYYFTFWQFLKKAPHTNFGKFVFFVSLLNFATSIAGPFFAVYMLQDLKLSYIWFSVINISASIFSLLTMPLWGKVSDKFGARQLLRIGSILIPFIPIFWLFSASPLYLALMPQLISGIGWAAFNLGVNNFTYASVTPQRRGICVAYLNMTNGFFVFLGATLGGFIVQYLPITFINKFLFIFLISGILRGVVSFAMMPKIKEVRQGEEIPPLLIEPHTHETSSGILWRKFAFWKR